VVVNLWGSWCGPCREEAPTLAKVARRFDHRVQFLGVDEADPSRVPAREHIRDFGLPYPSVSDPTRSVLTGLGYLGPPITLVFDAHGKRVETFTGPIRRASDLERAVRSVL
jgi:thiol-disulfide isomerase/thioredoxin